MADGLNKCMLIGALGEDPKLNTTQGGQPVLNLRMATNDSYKDRDGVWRERTDWHDVVVWGPRGEALSKILKKGSGLYIEGPIRSRSWDKPDGSKGYATEIHATEVILLGGKARTDEGESGGGYSRRASGPAPGRGGGYGGPAGNGKKDDIPF